MKDGCGYFQWSQIPPNCDEDCKNCPFTIEPIDRTYSIITNNNCDDRITIEPMDVDYFAKQYAPTHANSGLSADQLVESLESLRIDVDDECSYNDPTGVLRQKYERANEMLDDCINAVRRFFDGCIRET